MARLWVEFRIQILIASIEIVMRGCVCCVAKLQSPKQFCCLVCVTLNAFVRDICFNCIIVVGISLMNFMFIGELLVPTFHHYSVPTLKTSKLERFVALCLNIHVCLSICICLFVAIGWISEDMVIWCPHPHAGDTYHFIAPIHIIFYCLSCDISISFFC